MARIKAHQVIPALVIAAATGIPAAATVEFLNQAPSPAGVGSVAAPAATTSSPAQTSGTAITKPSSHKGSSPSAVSSIHLPPGISDDGGGDDGGGGRVRRYRTPTSTPRSSPTNSSSSGAASTGAVTHAGALNGSFTGSAVNDPLGTVQATITVSGGKITSVSASAPMGNQMSAAINQQAIPILRNETLQAQSPSVNLVSGATLTSQAYIQSLQSAVTQAHI